MYTGPKITLAPATPSRKAIYSKANGLKGRTLGLIGLGNIGRLVAKMAMAMDMNVIAWSRSLTDADAARLGVQRRLGPLDVASEADIVSLHVASNADTKGLANQVFFEAMKGVLPQARSNFDMTILVCPILSRMLPFGW